MLDANENESKNAKPLDKWVSEQTRNKDMQKFMEDHLIPDTDLSLSNFSDFVEKRKTILVQRIKKMINWFISKVFADIILPAETPLL